MIQKQNGQGAALRVAAYIRVSTDHFNQEESYETQERYFINLLSENANWISAGVYSDYGISATSEKNRTGFRRLMRHCRQGRLDRIVCKSISRFARNTRDFMVAIRTLRETGVTIFFEKENLDTGDSFSEFIFTTLGAIAQEESRSISENIRWGFAKRFPNGEARNYAIYGYRYAEGADAILRTENGYALRQLEIVEEEAEVVRRIFAEAAGGRRFIDIARGLNRDHIPPPADERTEIKNGSENRNGSSAEDGNTEFFMGKEEFRPEGKNGRKSDRGNTGKRSTNTDEWTESPEENERTEFFAEKEEFRPEGKNGRKSDRGNTGKRSTNTDEWTESSEENERTEFFTEKEEFRPEGKNAGSSEPENVNRGMSVRVKDGKLKDGIEQGWTAHRVGRILDQERYMGDALLQKTYTPDFLEHRTAQNRGELPKYYVRDHHPAIIDRAVYLKVKNSRANGGTREAAKALPFSGRLICAHCGRFYHTRNRNYFPIWYCPSQALRNGMDVCRAKRIYEEQIIRMFRKAVLERYGMLGADIRDDALKNDILSGRFAQTDLADYRPADEFEYFVPKMRDRMETVNEADDIERERTRMKKELLAMRGRKEMIYFQMRQYGPQKAWQECYDALNREEKELEEELERREAAWARFEADYPYREEAIRWMKTLPEGRQGTIEFLNGLTDMHVRAFVMSVTVHSPKRYTVRWFDDTETEVQLLSEVESHR